MKKDQDHKRIDTLADVLEQEFNKDKNSEKGNNFFENEQRLSNLDKQIKILFIGEDISEIRLNELRKAIIVRAKAKVQRGGGRSPIITKGNTSWLDKTRQNSIGWGKSNSDDIDTYRDRYFEYLKQYKIRSSDELNNTKTSVLNIVQNIGDPDSDESFSSRGLVIGAVQGGKTEHFTGVVATAFDAGYHLIIVMSGIMEDLRTQTQWRLRKDLLGSIDEEGVESISSFGPRPGQKNVPPIAVLTSMSNDFNTAYVDPELNLFDSKKLVICKKNISILKQLLVYLSEQTRDSDKEIPVLIIDDEADNATLNNNWAKNEQESQTTPITDKKETQASRINKRVRAILKLFRKSAYIGYTASPFANILQHRERDREVEKDKFEFKNREYEFPVCDGLFPKHFIELIKPPPLYIGLKNLFNTIDDAPKLLPMFGKTIIDHDEIFPRRINRETLEPTTDTDTKTTRAAKKDDPYPPRLPDSLKEAVYCFILSVAIRKTRARELKETHYRQPHNTMLIHISVFINWQNKTNQLLSEFVKNLSERLASEPLGQEDGIYSALESQFNVSYADSLTMGIDIEYLPKNYDDEFMTAVTFEEIKPLLAKTVEDIQCIALNSATKENLTYKGTPKTYIAIGGNRLSRGFTLEGLSVCYFLRDAKNADTLLQMGRWFGYRKGYLDCCKLFLTKDASDKFDEIARTVEHLEGTIEDLSNDATATPDTYALKVASNPGVIKLTRKSILDNTKQRKASFENMLEQTYRFLIDDSKIESAYSSVSKFISGESRNFQWEESRSMMVYRDAPLDFLQQLFACDQSFIGSDIESILRYIETCNKKGKLTDWTVAIKTKGDGGDIKSEDFGFSGHKMHSAVRRLPKDKNTRLTAIEELTKIQGPSFSVGGKSKGMLDPGDMKVATDKIEKINLAEEKWRADNPSVKRKTPPEKVFRHLLTEKQGVIILYFIDSDQIFKENERIIEGLEIKRQELKTNKPLIGFVIGTPIIAKSPKIILVEDKNIDNYIDLDEEDMSEPDDLPMIDE